MPKDLQKVFGTVDHNIQCNKLGAMSIGSAIRFRSYLSDITQKVKIGDSFRIHACYMWSAAGSILGPLPFLCYVKDMPVSVKSKLLLYADDSVLLVPHRDPRAISDTLSKELEACNEWLVDKRLAPPRKD